jgi:type IV pilus secretin PilQ/predicted competence protein
MLCLMGVVMTAGLAAAATLTGMSVSTEGEVTRIHVMLDEPVEFSQFALSDPPRLYVDCRGVSAILPKSLPAGTGRAGAIQASVWDGEGHHAMTRITIDLAKTSATEVTQVDGGLMIALSPDDGSQWTSDTPKPGDPETTTPAEAMKTAEPAPAAPTVPAATAPKEATPATAPKEATPATAPEEATPATAPEETVRPEAASDATSGETLAETAPAPMPEDAVPTLEELTSRNPETNSLDETADANRETETETSPSYSLPTGDEILERYTGHRNQAVTTFNLSDQRSLAGRSGARVSLDIQGADIYTVLRSISEYSGVNIVMGYDVKGEVKDPLSFHLENVPWGEALEMVLRSAHLWYREEGNIIRVDTEENLRNEELNRTHAARQLEEVMPLTTRIVEVIYAHARELKPSVEKTLSKRGVIEVDERTNSILITDIASRVEAAVQMVQHLDSQTPQVEIVAKMVDVDARYSRDLGVLWGVGGLHTSQGVSAEATLGANDVVDPSANVRFGVVRSWGTVSAVLSALERDNKANIISNPRVTTVNNREARILVGKKIPLIVLDEAGNAVTQLITIGITLRVTPHINDNNRITLDLHPEVSDLAAQATVQGGVIINTSEADTRVMVENGETAVIGGLIRANETTLDRGVPVLKDIPLVGGLFKNSSNVREKRELLIFVTPRIITTLASSDE